MPELVFTKPEDIKKLVGWTILEAGLLPPPRIGIGLRISHPVAACSVVISFIPSVVMGLSGNVVTASPFLTLEPRDVIEKEVE